MPYVRGFLRVMRRRDRWGRPVDPDYGVDVGEEGGGDEGGSPDQGFNPDYPWQGGPGGGYPGRPGQGLPRPPWGGERPGHGLPPSYPGRPTDPGYGVEGGGEAGQLPLFPLEPGQGLPGEGGGAPGQGLPGDPGVIWPPLPPGIGFHGRAILGCYVYYNGRMNHHFIVVTIPERPDRPVDPGHGVDEGGAPGQGLPGRPPQAGQPLPRPPGTMPGRS
jgi:integrin beta 8